MEVSREKINAFFRHTCTQDEAEIIAEYLKKNPEVLDEYLSKEDWDFASTQSALPEEFWNMQWEAIERRRKKTRIFVIARRVAAAAILLLAMGTGVYYLLSKNAENGNMPVETSIVNNSNKTIRNTTKTVMKIMLPDSSLAELQPNTEIVFSEFFEKNKRDVYLKGDAVFSVSKDSDRPFTVYSGTVSTTALGTRFRVIYTDNNEEAKVYLYEGKVVVRVINDKEKTSYLEPGDILSFANNIVKIYRGAQYLATSKGNENITSGADKVKVETDKKDIKNATVIEPGTAIPKWYKFEKESLANVFEQLSNLYNVEISYNRNVLRNKYFIGRFEKTDSIEKVLKTITDLNRLKLEKVSDNHYKIKE